MAHVEAVGLVGTGSRLGEGECGGGEVAGGVSVNGSADAVFALIMFT